MAEVHLDGSVCWGDTRPIGFVGIRGGTGGGWFDEADAKAGRCRVRVQVSGTVSGPSAGAAHLSLLGKRKLIVIPPGEYSRRGFVAKLEHATPIAETISVGLDGWAIGDGTGRGASNRCCYG